jgi:hypothetical protein
MDRKLGPGSEVDAYCTKCKLDLNHRIIAMAGSIPKRVECLTCRGHHNYRRPRDRDSEPAPRRGRGEAAAEGQTPPRSTRKADPKKAWEKAILGRSPDDFTAYAVSGSFAVGQLIRHSKFGEGVVSELIEGGKVSVLFEQGPKTLVHGR